MAKDNNNFSAEVKQRVLVESARHCCICREFCGVKMEIHHIKPKAQGGTSDFDNAIGLCFDCHSEVGMYNPKHPKGNKYGESELKKHRDIWYANVKENPTLRNFDDKDNEKITKIDTEIYLELKRCLLEKDVLIMKNLDFSLKNIPFSFLEPYYDFLEKCESPNFSFMDEELEICKIQLYNSLIKLHTDSIYKLHSDDGERVYVMRNLEDYAIIVDKLNQDSLEIWDNYALFIKTGREKLLV